LNRRQRIFFPAGFLPDKVLDEKLPLSVLEQARQQDMLWLVQCVDGTPVGYVMMESLDGLTLLAQIDVQPAHAARVWGPRLSGTRSVKCRPARSGSPPLPTYRGTRHSSLNMF
jgi:hypothetical protein